MDYEIVYEQHPQFLKATVTGRNQPQVVAGYLGDIVKECRERQCFRVLIHEKLSGPRLGTGDVFEIASAGAMSALGVMQAVAYVDEDMGEMAEFAETVAINRGMPVKTFKSVTDAERWLLAQREGPEEQDIFGDGRTPRP